MLWAAAAACLVAAVTNTVSGGAECQGWCSSVSHCTNPACASCVHCKASVGEPNAFENVARDPTLTVCPARTRQRASQPRRTTSSTSRASRGARSSTRASTARRAPAKAVATAPFPHRRPPKHRVRRARSLPARRARRCRETTFPMRRATSGVRRSTKRCTARTADAKIAGSAKPWLPLRGLRARPLSTRRPRGARASRRRAMTAMYARRTWFYDIQMPFCDQVGMHTFTHPCTATRACRWRIARSSAKRSTRQRTATGATARDAGSAARYNLRRASLTMRETAVSPVRPLNP
eukprot:1846-Prymnesium_polylepis.2